MKVARINRMMLGVSRPVAVFCDSVFGTSAVDVDDPADTAGCDVLIVGRQQLRDTGIYSFAHDVIPRCLEVHRPGLLIAVIPDHFERHRYARDLTAWQHAKKQGVGVAVFEFGVLRERKDDPALVAIARTNSEAAKSSSSPLAWLSGAVLSA